MNFLGHLYFSHDDLALMQANLFGDFVKGKDLSRYSLKIQEGITLHRKIDHYIDHHPSVSKLLHILYEPLPKVASIAVDLYFDHLLAKNWNLFHSQTLENFLENFYNSINPSIEFYTADFQLMLAKMKEKNWLFHYQSLYGLEKSCVSVSNRISFDNKLKEGVVVFEKYQKEIEMAFYEYMKDAQLFFRKI